MSDSDDSGPPPLAGEGSDSSGPPPLVDSSSDDERPPMQQNASSEESEESEEDDHSFAQLFQMMQQRGQHGIGWRQALGSNQPLALGDRMSTAEQKRIQARKAEEERQQQQRLEEQRRDEERARKRTQLGSLADAYRQAKRTEQRALERKNMLERAKELEACCEECEELISKVHVTIVRESDIACEARRTETLAIALQAECYARWSMCELPTECNGQTPLELAAKAKDVFAQLPSANSESLGQGLKGRLNGIQARLHVAYGFAHLRLGHIDIAKESAQKAKSYLSTSLKECPKLESFLEDEEQKLVQKIESISAQNAKQDQKAKQDAKAAVAQASYCEWGCGFEFAANATRKEKHAHREKCEFRLDKCQKCQQTGIRVCDMTKHLEEACTARLEPCPKCGQMVRKDALARHAKDECEERDVPCDRMCDGCEWVGPLSLKEHHGEVCPYNWAQCQYCLEDMREWEMLRHQCPLADGAEDCMICCEQLFTKPVAMLMKTKDKMCLRTCDHFQMHVDCAEDWRSESLRMKFAKNKSDTVSSTCPSCDREYDLVTALPDFLVVPPDDSKIRTASSHEKAITPTVTPVATQKSQKSKKSEVISQPKLVAESTPKKLPAAKAKAQAQPEKVISPTVRGPAAVPKSKAPALPKPQLGVASASSSSTFHPKSRTLTNNTLNPLSEGTAVADAIDFGEVLPDHVEAVIRTGPANIRSWMTELERRRPILPERMRPSPEKHKEYETFRLAPSEIHFCHDAVNEYFQSFRDANGIQQDSKSILDTVREMAEAELSGKHLPLEPIRVVWYTKDEQPRWTVAGTYNRRLVVYRLLSIFMPDIFRQMKVIRWPLDSVKWYHTNGPMKGLPYHSTRCRGVYVEVGRDSGKYVGKHEHPQGEDEVGVKWPAAKDVFRRLHASRRGIIVHEYS